MNSNNFPLLPDQASTFAEQTDPIFWVLTALTVFFTVVVLFVLTVLAIRYRRGSKANRKNASHHNIVIELAWSLPPLFLGLAVFAWSVKPYAEVFNPPTNAEEIFVIGKRWMWHIQHATNGIREMNELHVPMGRPFKLTLISQDVIHGFYVPDFRVKRDAIPGKYNTCWFQATKPGKHHLFCTEFCGTNHSQMGGWVYVMTPADYEKWVASGGTNAVTAPVTPEQSGYDVFTQLACANCHKTEDSVRAPSLVGLFGKRRQLQNGQIVTADDNYIRAAIRTPEDNLLAGYGPTMPSYKDQLDEQQLHDLNMYIKSLGKSKTATPAPPASPAGAAPTRPTGSSAPKPNTGSNTP